MSTDSDDDLHSDPDFTSGGSADRLSAIEAKLARAEIARDFGIPDEAAAKVYEIAKASNLTMVEAAAVAATRDPKAFGSAGNEAGFASLRPRAGAVPESLRKETLRERFEAINKMAPTNRRRAFQELHRVIGHHAAKAIGWETRLRPLDD